MSYVWYRGRLHILDWKICKKASSRPPDGFPAGWEEIFSAGVIGAADYGSWVAPHQVASKDAWDGLDTTRFPSPPTIRENAMRNLIFPAFACWVCKVRSLFVGPVNHSQGTRATKLLRIRVACRKWSRTAAVSLYGTCTSSSGQASVYLYKLRCK